MDILIESNVNKLTPIQITGKFFLILIYHFIDLKKEIEGNTGSMFSCMTKKPKESLLFNLGI